MQNFTEMSDRGFFLVDLRHFVFFNLVYTQVVDYCEMPLQYGETQEEICFSGDSIMKGPVAI